MTFIILNVFYQNEINLFLNIQCEKDDFNAFQFISIHWQNEIDCD